MVKFTTKYRKYQDLHINLLASRQKILYNILRRDLYCLTKGANQPVRLYIGEEACMDIIKVSGKSRTSAVAGAIAGVFRERQHVEVQAIGASAINQAVKAMALAKSYLAEDGYAVVFIPEFVDVEIDEKVRTAIKFVI